MKKVTLLFVSAFLLWRGSNYLLTSVQDNPAQPRFVETAAAGHLPGMEKAFRQGAPLKVPYLKATKRTIPKRRARSSSFSKKHGGRRTHDL